MSSLRAFRFQKVRKAGASTGSGSEDSSAAIVTPEGTPTKTPVGVKKTTFSPSAFSSSSSSVAAASPSLNKSLSNGSAVYNLETDTESPDMFRPAPPKRSRVLSDDSDDVVMLSPSKTSPSSSNGNGSFSAAVTPSPEIIEARLDVLQRTFPNKDRMELQDALRQSNWVMEGASALLRGDDSFVSKRSPENKKKKPNFPKKKSAKRHEEDAASESDSEGEYNNANVVYESDSEDEDADGSGYFAGADETNLSEDKKRVLHFFNTAQNHELAAIQGCSKKKVSDLVELRPFEGWGDLVRKVQLSRSLNTDMLNSATLLIRMRDAVARLMEKCEKITRKMETMVEELTRGETAGMELTEQPKIMSVDKGLRLTGYQMIGLNWLVLMHKQSLNGILADEMGLGKTIQAIAFLAHLKEKGDGGPHLIIVPSSTMENWQKEISTWCPSLQVLNYYGSQDERRHMRLQIVNEEVDFDVILTTYNMVISSADDRVLFRKLDFHYVIFDEAHMLKNMSTARYENLMRVQAQRKLLLTGTPLQNNLVELMSLLVFVMPDMFANKKEQLKKMFALFPKSQDTNSRSRYEKDRIAHAKRIMKPFFLRRLKSEVLTELPKKSEEVIRVPMSKGQQELYFKLVADYKERARKLASGELTSTTDSGVGFLMNLRKAANHPLLIRNHYDADQIRVLGRLLKRNDSSHKEANEAFIVEDLGVMSDFYIHKTCLAYRCIEHYSLGNHQLCDSGKFAVLDKLLPDMKERNDRVLMFTQFTMVLDIMELYLKIRGHKFLRLDGSTPVQERQMLIDEFNKDNRIFIFILSTKAGGLGINLTSANTVILHDLDFNPYNDKQAEDRCHRVGQTRPVRVIRFLSVDTIEEGIYSIAQDKLKLEQDLSGGNEEDKDDKTTNKKDLKKLLKIALDVEMSEKQMGDVGKVFTEL